MDFSRRFDMAAAAILLLVFFATVYLTQDFITTILLSVVLVFLLKPLYSLFLRLTHNSQISSFFSILIVFVLILAILMGITTVLLVELSNLEKSGALSGIHLSAIADIADQISLQAKSALPGWAYNYADEKIRESLQEISDIPVAIATWLFPIVKSELSSFAANLPIFFAQLIVAVFFTYYLLIDGGNFVKSGLELLPGQKRWIMRNFLQELAGIYDTLFSVYFTTSMLSGALAAIGFSLLGVPYPFVLGAVVGIFTLLPMLGPPFVFVPMALYYLATGDMMRSVIIVVFGMVVLMVIPENVIRPHLAMKSARIHPVVTLLAYTAPIFVVGIIGVIVGPALYGFLLAAFRAAATYRET